MHCAVAFALLLLSFGIGNIGGIDNWHNGVCLMLLSLFIVGSGIDVPVDVQQW